MNLLLYNYLLASFGADNEIWLWLIFGALIAAFLIIDLGITNKKAKAISTKTALYQSLFWVGVALSFSAFIYYEYDPVGDKTAEDSFKDYLSAYIMEYALSVDNIFVIILILRYFKIKEDYYHGVLFWGILGAMVMRGFFIFVGEYAIHRFEWILYVFGFFLLFTGYKMLVQRGEDNDFDPEANPMLKFARRFFHFTSEDHGDKFFVRKNGQLFFTTLFMALLLIESSDLIFAVDSIPAAFGITSDPVIIYTSNIFAVMGLRAMFFLLSGILDRFYLLPKGLSIVLIFIGVKMLGKLPNDIYRVAEYFYAPDAVPAWAASLKGVHFHINSTLSLMVIVSALTITVLLSIFIPQKNKEADNKEA